MTPIGKFAKILLAFIAAGFVLYTQGCKAETPAARPSSPAKGTVDIKVTTNGYEPSPIALKKGEPVTLRVTRTTDETCATDILLPGYGIEKKLPLNEPVEITFTPKESGQLKYGCSMGQMVSGVFVIE